MKNWMFFMLFYFKKVSKRDTYLKCIFNTWNSKTRQTSKIQWVFPEYYCVQQFTKSSKILCPNLHLKYTCSTFSCWYTAVVSCCARRSSFIYQYYILDYCFYSLMVLQYDLLSSFKFYWHFVSILLHLFLFKSI